VAGALDLSLGRIRLPTLMDDVAESVGDQLQAVGGGVAPGARQPRAFNLTIPIYGAPQDLDPTGVANRLRRQVRSLMENSQARLQGVYLYFNADPELNTFMLIGSADIVYSDGGPSLGDYQLKLNDGYAVARYRTHRGARRLEIYDRRLATTPRDYLRTVYTTDFASLAGMAVHGLPIGVSDIVGYGRASLPAYPTGGSPARQGLEGFVPMVVFRTHGEVVSYEASERLRGKGDVVVWDRRGSPLGPYRVNLATNPSAEINTAAWGANSGTLARVTTQFAVGAAAFQGTAGATGGNNYYTDGAISGSTAGRTFVGSVWVKGTGSTIGKSLTVFVSEAGGSQAEDTANTHTDQTVVLTATWQRVSCTRTVAQNDRTIVRLYVVQQTGAATGDVIFFDGAMIEEATALGTYFDGSTPGAYLLGQPSTNSQSAQMRGFRANLWTNPSATVDISGIGINSGNTERVTRDPNVSPFPGGTSIRVDVGSPQFSPTVYQQFNILPGIPYIASCYFKGTRGKSYFLTTDVRNAGSVGVQGLPQVNFVGTGDWQRVSTTGTVAGDAATGFLHVGPVATGAGAADTYWVAGIQFEQGSQLLDAFDGDSLFSSWAGTRGNSISYNWGDPQDAMGWEEVYGPDYPLAAGDVPVLANGLCRVRWRPISSSPSAAGPYALALDSFVPGQGYIEQGMIVVWPTGAWINSVVAAAVVEWTPDRAVVRATVLDTSGNRADVYITLQRAWQGPVVELYGPSSNTHGIGFYSFDAVSLDVATSAGAYAGIDVPGTLAFGTEPWVQLLPGSATYKAVTMTWLRGGGYLGTQSRADLYDGANRWGYFLQNNLGTPTWHGARFSAVARGAAFEAEAWRSASSTASQVADAAASGGQAVQDTQTVETSATLIANSQLTRPGQYGVWARVRVSAAGTGTFRARSTSGGSVGGTVTTTSTTYVWLYLGTLTTIAGDNMIQINMWGSAAGVNPRIDRVIVVPTSQTTDLYATYDGTRDLMSQHLYDNRVAPELVGR
jgi:hypothetical protein